MKIMRLSITSPRISEMKTIVEAVDDMTAFTHLTDGIISTIASSESGDLKEVL